MDIEEKPIVHMDHRLYHNEPRIVLDVYDLGDIPKKVKLSVHRMMGFDDVLQEFRRPPSKWLNHWAKFDRLPEPVPVLFDVDGQPYIIVPAKHQETAPLLNAIVADLIGTKPMVKIYIHEESFEEILDRLETATDFCDRCSHPLPKNAYEWLNYASGGGAIADVFNCSSCEHENIRFSKEFIEEHPELELG
uniref:Uncharacterized protein n=1 Tax=viral metagenome TaxID=1070528 RepID=A0A6M3LVN0_9ZZZZ